MRLPINRYILHETYLIYSYDLNFILLPTHKFFSTQDNKIDNELCIIYCIIYRQYRIDYIR